MFLVTLDTTDTGTLGRLRVFHSEPATYLEVWQDFMVVPQQVWDSMFGADKLDVAVVEQANIDFGALQKASLNAATPVATLANDALSAAALKTDAVTEIVTAILAGNLADAQSFSANTLADLMRKVFWMVSNKMVVVDATGNYTLYKSDGVTPAATGSIVDDATNTTRSVPDWTP